MRLGAGDLWRQWPWIALFLSTTIFTVVESLQCYTCRGVPYYDPDSCFAPYRGRTVRQECNRGEVCETRIHKSESFEKIVERGCTNACGDRKFVWTDYFQVHCCDENECNTAHATRYSLPVLVLSSVFTLLLLTANVLR